MRELKLHRSWAGTGGSPARAAGGRGWGQGWCGATQHVSLREAPSSCETQTTPVPDKAGIFCLTLLTMPVLEIVTHRVEFAGDVHARRVLVSPQHSPAAPCLLQARSKPQGTSCLSPKLHIQIVPRFLSVKPNFHVTTTGSCLPSGSSWLESGLHFATESGKIRICRASCSRGAQGRHRGSS